MSTATTTATTAITPPTTNPEIQAENKMTNENLPNTYSSKTSISKKQKGRNTVNQNSTVNTKFKKCKSTKYTRKKRRREKKSNKNIKHLNGWKLSKKVSSDCVVHVKHFSGTTTDSMKNYAKSSLRIPWDHFIRHVGQMI